jgi:GNAT superfamily N-acetyltransferase
MSRVRMILEDTQIIDINQENIRDYCICGYKNTDRPGHKEKIDWVMQNIENGLRMQILYSKKDKEQGYIEYIDGEHVSRPIDAGGYVAIHCIFVGFKKSYKGQGYGSLLIRQCIREAIDRNKSGVCVVTRKGPFMADERLFLKNGFETVDFREPDFRLLVLRFDDKGKLPSFKKEVSMPEGPGIIIMRSSQCPYTVKNVSEIICTAKRKYGLETRVVDMDSPVLAQDCPSGFGSFCLIYNSRILSYHPVSNKRFENMMEAVLGEDPQS